MDTRLDSAPTVDRGMLAAQILMFRERFWVNLIWRFATKPAGKTHA
jgi:hypothetical protein